MTDPEAPTMDEASRDAFLGTGGTGVLAFGRPARQAPHAIPVSYGYDAEGGAFYFRLSVAPDSEKGDPADRPVTFVVHGRAEERWASVVATGRLEATDADDVGTEALAGLDRVHIPLFDVFGEPASDVPFSFYRLAPDSVTTRRERSVAP